MIARVEAGVSVFYTGSAGTGKSYLLLEIIRRLCRMHGKKHVAVTASTGVAACNIGGSTLNSWAGVSEPRVGSCILMKVVWAISNHRSAFIEAAALYIARRTFYRAGAICSNGDIL